MVSKTFIELQNMIYLSHKNGHFDHEQYIDQHSYKSINCADASLYPVSKIGIKQNSNKQFYFNFRGTIVPFEWKSITTKDGKKLSRGALELYAIIVSWHNYKKIKDKDTGKIALVPKFEGNELRKNYEYFIKELNRSQEQVRRYFAELKAANLVSMELRTVWHKNWKYPNTLCIKLNKEAPHFAKGQGVDCKTSAEKPFTAHEASTSDIVSNLGNAELSIKNLDQSSNGIKDAKKKWASLHKKVGSI